MTVVVLVLVFCCSLCEGQGNEDSDKDHHRPGLTSPLHSIIRNQEAMAEKMENMAEKMIKMENMAEDITVLKAKLQNADEDILELRSLTGGNGKLDYINIIMPHHY